MLALPTEFFIFPSNLSPPSHTSTTGDYALGIIVLDFGGQYAHLIAYRIRRLRVFAEIRSPTTDVSELAEADGLILSGGPSSVYDEEAPAYNPEIFAMGKPMLGLCYGHQLLCVRLGGLVEPGGRTNLGRRICRSKRRPGYSRVWTRENWCG